jgi:capsid portal protein
MTVRQMLAKARAAVGPVDESRAIQEIDATAALFGNSGAVEAPYDPESLINYAELSPHLEPSIEAYSQNVDGFGHQFVPAESWMDDLDKEEATRAIGQALSFERWVAREEGRLAYEADVAAGRAQVGEPPPRGQLPEINPEEVEAAREEIRTTLERERFIARAFFDTCCSDMSFGRLRRITRRDIETHGWGTTEMRPDGLGRLKRLSYVPAYTVRPLQDDGTQVLVQEPDPVTPLSGQRTIAVYRRFRRYVQLVGQDRIYFKSPGDPRTISLTTGRPYMTIADMMEAEGNKAIAASELLWASLHSPRTPCPPPRWIGALLGVLGSREADETNYYYLRDNATPAGLIFVSGGRLTQQTVQRLEQRVGSELRGARGAGKLLVLEAFSGQKTTVDPTARTQIPTISWEPLRDARQQDALFTNYDQRNADKIGATFRLSPMLRGFTPSDLNRATALASLQFAEQQVFQPLREEFDWNVNRVIMPRLGIRFLNFKSNSPPTKSAEEVGALVQQTAPYGGLIPREIRQLLADVLNVPLTKIEEPWTTQPMPMTLAGYPPPGTEAPTPAGGGSPFGMDADPAGMAGRLAALEQRIAAIATDELRAAGLDPTVSARFVDVPAVASTNADREPVGHGG